MQVPVSSSRSPASSGSILSLGSSGSILSIGTSPQRPGAAGNCGLMPDPPVRCRSSSPHGGCGTAVTVSGGWSGGQDDGCRVLMARCGGVVDGHALSGADVVDHHVPQRGLGGDRMTVDRGDHVTGGEPGLGGGTAGYHASDRHAGARCRGAAVAEPGSRGAGGALPDP